MVTSVPPVACHASQPTRRKRPFTRRPNKTCVECGAGFYANPKAFDRRHYCSIACRNRALRGERSGAFRLPEEPASWVDTLPKALALVETQLAEATDAEAALLEIERDALLWLCANPTAARWTAI